METAYYVIEAAQWNAAMASLGWIIFFLIGMVWWASVNWIGVFDFWRRQARRRRIRNIRQLRMQVRL